MQTGYQVLCHTQRLFVHCVEQRQPRTGVQSFYKFNCALMSANLRQPDAICEPDCPVGRAEEKRQRLPKEKQTQCLHRVLVETRCVTNAITFQSVQEHHRLQALMVTNPF